MGFPSQEAGGKVKNLDGERYKKACYRRGLGQNQGSFWEG